MIGRRLRAVCVLAANIPAADWTTSNGSVSASITDLTDWQRMKKCNSLLNSSQKPIKVRSARVHVHRGGRFLQELSLLRGEVRKLFMHFAGHQVSDFKAKMHQIRSPRPSSWI